MVRRSLLSAHQWLANSSAYSNDWTHIVLYYIVACLLNSNKGATNFLAKAIGGYHEIR